MSAFENPEIFRTILDDLLTGIYLVDRDRKILFWNRGAERITGYLRQEVVGRCCHDNILAHCDVEGSPLCVTDCPLVYTMRDGRPRAARVYLLHRLGHRLPVQVRTVAIHDSRGVIIGAAESFDERAHLSERVRDREILARHACLDALTGVGNRMLTESRLGEQLALFLEHQLPFGVLRVRIEQPDHFRAVYGHEALDTLLRAVARTLKNMLRSTDIVGRWAAQEFLVVLPAAENADVKTVGKRVRSIAACSRIEWWGDQLPVRISVAATGARPGETLQLLIQRIESIPGGGETQDLEGGAQTG
jgi:diguanylate cyclase (GGDEF)-like protein/PAS domain S-box-containing protein